MASDILVEGLHKYYGRIHAVRGASFTVPRSSVFGLLGPNGAGKTTTIKAIVGLLKPSKGRILIRGRPAGSIDAKRLLGYAPERFSIGGGWRILDFLVYVARLYRIPPREAEERSLQLLEWVGLSGWEHERFSSLSAGMRRRLGLAQALIGDPRILILDEPTEHLDALGRLELLNKIRELAESGKTVMLSTHVLAEAELVVDHFAIMHRGRIIYQGSTDSLRRGMTVRLEVDKPSLLVDALRGAGIRYSMVGSRVILEGGEDVGERVLRICLERGIRVRRYEVGSIRLSEFFVKLVSGEGYDGA